MAVKEVQLISQPTLSLDVNTGSQGSPTWTNITLPMSGTGIELRWSDQGTLTATASASWPAFTKPSSGTTGPGTFFLYYFSADTTGSGITGGATPVAFSNANYNMLRWSDAGNGTWASAPNISAWDDSTHTNPSSRNLGTFPNNLGGNSGDTGTPARSYLKCNAYGYFNQTPGVAPTNAPQVTDGSTGALTTGTAAWLANYQGLMSTLDFITCGLQPSNNTAQKWYFMLALCSGANMATGTYSSTVVSLQFSWM